MDKFGYRMSRVVHEQIYTKWGLQTSVFTTL